ncbi:MAG TPA: rod shape-determining protein RodA [Candidatus Avidesulfovibrio excrementigallinarum]|nr:rod shape-determining protein RodA [Candidatus Avidesulfovibrio excrementigallinarum]
MLIDRRLITHINWGLLATLFALFFVGVLNLYSASGVRLEDGLSLSSFYQRQLVWGGCGTLTMLCVMSFDYKRLTNISTLFYGLVLLLLLMVPLFGKIVYGAKRWLDLGFFQLQPSEFAKIAVLILGAQLLAQDASPLSWTKLAKILCVGLVPTAFILCQPDLGTSLTLLFILSGMILYHGIRPAVFKTCLVIIPLLLPLGWFAMHDYQKQRILTFLDPSNDPLGAGYHITQSQIAIGSGQFWGKGFLQGTQSQLRFLPEKHTDFAVAVFGEEWGFIGCVGLLLLYCLFLLAIFNTVRSAKDRFGSTLAAGVFVYFFWQILINMGMVLGLMPVVGIPLPFMSYGGSATLLNFALAGLVLNISMRRFIFKS